MSRPRNPAKRNVSNQLKLNTAQQKMLQATANQWGMTRSETYRMLLVQALENRFIPRVPTAPESLEAFQLNLSPPTGRSPPRAARPVSRPD